MFIHLSATTHCNNFIPDSLDTMRALRAGVVEANTFLTCVSPSQLHPMGLAVVQPCSTATRRAGGHGVRLAAKLFAWRGGDALFNQIIFCAIFPTLQNPSTVQSGMAVLGMQSYRATRGGWFSMDGFKKLFALLGPLLLCKNFSYP